MLYFEKLDYFVLVQYSTSTLSMLTFFQQNSHLTIRNHKDPKQQSETWSTYSSFLLHMYQSISNHSHLFRLSPMRILWRAALQKKTFIKVEFTKLTFCLCWATECLLIRTNLKSLLLMWCQPHVSSPTHSILAPYKAQKKPTWSPSLTLVEVFEKSGYLCKTPADQLM